MAPHFFSSIDLKTIMSQRDGVFVKQLGFARSPGISSLPGSVTGRLSPPSSSLMAWACRKEWDVLHRVFVSSKMCYFLTTTIYIPQSQKKSIHIICTQTEARAY